MDAIFPAALSWAAVTGGVTDLLSNGIVVGGIIAVLTLRFAPKFVRGLLSATRGR